MKYMTSQNKKFVELSDILALRLECKRGKCRTSITIPFAQNLMGKEVRTCPSCGEPWAQFGEASYETVVTDFADKLRRFR
ncbi:MAG TPA: hypothetical protein VLW06_00680, partial [Terriglobales bacterium]|nr:hypothetical protein [Terriglobales bacterium]